MIPDQVLRVPIGDGELLVGVFRMPYLGGRDAFTHPGGLFTSSDGEVGLLLDSSLRDEDVEAAIRRELQKNLGALREALRVQTNKTSAAARAAMS
jgi:hypothetical protein